jgi:hypothetical protein
MHALKLYAIKENCSALQRFGIKTEEIKDMKQTPQNKKDYFKIQ